MRFRKAVNKVLLGLLVVVAMVMVMGYKRLFNKPPVTTELYVPPWLVDTDRFVEETDTHRTPWWKEVLCRRGGHSPVAGDNVTAVPLMRLWRDITPEKNNNIFLMDTSCNPKPKYRAWCSVESWARKNPDRQVWFLNTAGRLEGREELIPFLQQQYPNMHLVTAEVSDLFWNTPLLPLFYSRMWTGNETWPVELMSDMLRTVLLWWWGGVYSDTDVINLRGFTLPPNSVAFERKHLIGSAVYAFRAGHPTLQTLMEDMQAKFKPEAWGTIGPEAITRVMLKECGITLAQLRHRAPFSCPGNVTVHPTSVFYHYDWYTKYFTPGGGENFDTELRSAYAIHIWNRRSRNATVTFNDNSVYEVAARRYCPITYQTAKEHSIPL